MQDPYKASRAFARAVGGRGHPPPWAFSASMARLPGLCTAPALSHPASEPGATGFDSARRRRVSIAPPAGHGPANLRGGFES